MSYKLVNANDLVISYPEVNINSFPCIFADLPNGIDGGHYDLTLANIDLIRSEIEAIQQDVLKSSETPLDSAYNISIGISMALGVIDKYR